jgi:hypothetical protein
MFNLDNPIEKEFAHNWAVGRIQRNGGNISESSDPKKAPEVYVSEPGLKILTALDLLINYFGFRRVYYKS